MGVLLRMAGLSLVWVGLSPGVGQAQLPNEAPRFEVTSVKQNSSETTASSLNHDLPARFSATNVPLFFLILDAYEIKGHQLMGAPDWAWSKSYDVVGTFPAGARPDLHRVHLMEQQLLAERFNLKLRPEQREVQVYDLVLAKKDGDLGPQFHKSNMDCAASTASGRSKKDGATKSPVSPTGERPVCALLATRTWLSGGARTVQDLASSLESMLDRPVVDKTGLTGRYDMDLQWARMDLHADGNNAEESASAPSLFTAVQEQLGLKLVSRKELYPVLVVDHVEAPTPN